MKTNFVVGIYKEDLHVESIRKYWNLISNWDWNIWRNLWTFWEMNLKDHLRVKLLKDPKNLWLNYKIGWIQCVMHFKNYQKCWNILSRYINKSQSISPFFESWLSTKSGLTTSVVVDLASWGFFSGDFSGERNCQSGRPKFDTGGLLGNLELKQRLEGK